jgi:hypothetical protein
MARNFEFWMTILKLQKKCKFVYYEEAWIMIVWIALFMYCLLLETRGNMSHLDSYVCHWDVLWFDDSYIIDSEWGLWFAVGLESVLLEF